MKTTIINLVSGPGAGKSTTAAGLFHQIKLDGNYSSEIVMEVVKDYTYDKNEMALKDQILITAEQNHKLFRLIGEVEYVISDASLINGIVYNRFYHSENEISDKLALDLFSQYDNMVFLLPRKAKYSHIGRTQSEDQAKELDRIFVEVLNDYKIPYHDMSTFSHDKLPEQIIKLLGA